MELTAEFRAKTLAKVLGARVHDCGAGWHYALDSDPELHQGWIDVPEGNDYRCALEDALLAKDTLIEFKPSELGIEVCLREGEMHTCNCYLGVAKGATDALTLAAARAHNMEVPDA